MSKMRSFIQGVYATIGLGLILWLGALSLTAITWLILAVARGAVMLWLDIARMAAG